MGVPPVLTHFSWCFHGIVHSKPSILKGVETSKAPGRNLGTLRTSSCDSWRMKRCISGCRSCNLNTMILGSDLCRCGVAYARCQKTIMSSCTSDEYAKWLGCTMIKWYQMIINSIASTLGWFFSMSNYKSENEWNEILYVIIIPHHVHMCYGEKLECIPGTFFWVVINPFIMIKISSTLNIFPIYCLDEHKPYAMFSP